MIPRTSDTAALMAANALVGSRLDYCNPKYFEPFLIPRHSAYNTRRSQSDGIFLEVPHFASVFKSQKHFGLSFAYDTPMIGMTFLMRSALQTHLPLSGQSCHVMPL